METAAAVEIPGAMENAGAMEAAGAVENTATVETSKKPSVFLAVVLGLAVLALTALDIYQDKVIRQQQFELRWLVTHSTIRPETILADIQNQKQSARPAGTQAQASPVAPTPSQDKGIPSAAPAVKP
jgi:hypothetical protein